MASSRCTQRERAIHPACNLLTPLSQLSNHRCFAGDECTSQQTQCSRGVPRKHATHQNAPAHRRLYSLFCILYSAFAIRYFVFAMSPRRSISAALPETLMDAVLDKSP